MIVTGITPGLSSELTTKEGLRTDLVALGVARIQREARCAICITERFGRREADCAALKPMDGTNR